jgi:diaminohydroxyphosphoribosylaminopyrimidine deaminase/5-amino-6-(5-phosphoribosylamino)uracil reductase
MSGDARAADRHFMQLALALGRRGLGRTWPNPAVGAVLVREDGGGRTIVGRGWTQPGGRPHAETEALARAGAAAEGATLYVTLEPCSHFGRTPPCADAIVAAGVARVVAALEDPNPIVAGEGHARLRASNVAVEIGLCADAAARAHAGHIRRVRDHRPHVLVKIAVSADGKVGLAGRRPVAITGDAAGRRVHLLRATHDAVLTGIGTALADDPLLTCRLPGMEPRSPVRVVLDTRLRLSPASRLVQTARKTPLWILTSAQAGAEREQALVDHGAHVFRVAARDGGLDLSECLALLAGRGITRLMVEGGPILAAGLLAADLVDELVLLRGPQAIGPDGLDAVEGQPLTALTGSPRLRSLAMETLAPDTIETFVRTCSPAS